jgi:N-acylglucosamine 2-epimerase
MNPDQWRQIASDQHRELLSTVAFWEQHSIDQDHGGFLFYLDRTGTCYGTDKPVWLIGRATWLFATLYTQVEQRRHWLDLALHGWRFLTNHCAGPNGKLYFLVDQQGRPLRMRRYVYSEVFACLAAAALHRATGEAHYLEQAIEFHSRFKSHLHSPAAAQPKINPAVRPAKALAPLMCNLLMTDTLADLTDDQQYDIMLDAMQAEIKRDFLHRETGVLLETVGPSGEPLEGPDGRVCNPGHTIEAAWFMLMIERRRCSSDTIPFATKVIKHAFKLGWDSDYGGLRYFVDVEGQPPYPTRA